MSNEEMTDDERAELEDPTNSYPLGIIVIFQMAM